MLKKKVKMKLADVEIEKLNELLIFAMEEMMEINTKNRFSNPPILNQEQKEHLENMMDFCNSLLKQIRHT